MSSTVCVMGIKKNYLKTMLSVDNVSNTVIHDIICKMYCGILKEIKLEIVSRRSVSPDGTQLRREYVSLEPVSWNTRSGFSIVPDYSQKLITSSFTYICL